MWAIFLPQPFSLPVPPFSNFFFPFTLGNPEGLISTKLLFFAHSIVFRYVFFPPPPHPFLGPFRPPARTHRGVPQPKQNFENFKSEIITLRTFSVHWEEKRTAFDLGPFYGTQNFLEASQDGSSPSLFVREAIL